MHAQHLSLLQVGPGCAAQLVIAPQPSQLSHPAHVSTVHGAMQGPVVRPEYSPRSRPHQQRRSLDGTLRRDQLQLAREGSQPLSPRPASAAAPASPVDVPRPRSAGVQLRPGQLSAAHATVALARDTRTTAAVCRHSHSQEGQPGHCQAGAQPARQLRWSRQSGQGWTDRASGHQQRLISGAHLPEAAFLQPCPSAAGVHAA